MAGDIKQKIVLEGEKEYARAMSDAARQIKTLNAEERLAHSLDISTRITLLEKGHIIKDLSNENGSAKAELENYFDQETE